MLKVRGKLVTPELDVKGFTLRMEGRLIKEQHKAIRVWLINILSHIPTYTGTTKGTFAPIGRAVNLFFTASPTENGKAKKFFRYQGKKYPLGFKQGERYQQFEITQTNIGKIYEYAFKFENTLLYAVWNELYPAPAWLSLIQPTPWNALKLGAKAWLKYVREDLPKHLPKPTPSIKAKVVRVR